MFFEDILLERRLQEFIARTLPVIHLTTAQSIYMSMFVLCERRDWNEAFLKNVKFRIAKSALLICQLIIDKITYPLGLFGGLTEPRFYFMGLVGGWARWRNILFQLLNLNLASNYVV